MIKLVYLLLLLLQAQFCLAQKHVAITIDDVPNTGNYEEVGFIPNLLKTTDSLNIPITVFINESHIYKTDSVVQNFLLLYNWIKREYVTLGNHTYSHLRYSEVSYSDFKNDILKGEAITRQLALKENKRLDYFRFPYNDLGMDNNQYDSITVFLNNHKYTVAPFTIESSDWVFNALYEHYLKLGREADAKRIAEEYIQHSLNLFDYFETISDELFHRPIYQIYLCHDNALNARYLPVLVKKLKSDNYSFISLGEALEDKVYLSKVHYKGKWGFTWIYRWIEDTDRRKALMKAEPSIVNIFEEYENINGKW